MIQQWNAEEDNNIKNIEVIAVALTLLILQ